MAASAAAAAPVAVGTRGTVGSLVRREIEYFRSFDRPHFDQRSCNSRGNIDNPQRERTRLSSWFSKANWRRKRRRSSGGGGGFLPRICSAAEVSGGNSRIPGFSYRILRSEEKGSNA